MKRERGAALVLALVALTIVGLCVMVTAGQVQAQQAKARYDARSAVLAALSDAAFAETLAQLSVDVDSNGVAERAFGGGVIASGVEPSGEHGRRVIATATYRGWSATIDADIDVSTGPTILRLRRAQAPIRAAGDTQ